MMERIKESILEEVKRIGYLQNDKYTMLHITGLFDDMENEGEFVHHFERALEELVIEGKLKRFEQGAYKHEGRYKTLSADLFADPRYNNPFEIVF